MNPSSTRVAHRYLMAKEIRFDMVTEDFNGLTSQQVLWFGKLLMKQMPAALGIDPVMAFYDHAPKGKRLNLAPRSRKVREFMLKTFTNWRGNPRNYPDYLRP